MIRFLPKNDAGLVDLRYLRLYHPRTPPPGDALWRASANRPRSVYELPRFVADKFEVPTMSQDVLRQAENAIAEKIRESSQPVDTRTALGEIANETSLDEFDLRAAVWRLIGKGTIVLTEDRRLAPRVPI